MKYTAYKSLDDMLKGLNIAMKIADSKTNKLQKDVKPGDYYIQNTEYGFPIFGEILKNEEPIYKEPHMKNYRLVKAYSIACPDGEIGDVHVSSISYIIKKEEFEKYKNQGWNEDEP